MQKMAITLLFWECSIAIVSFLDDQQIRRHKVVVWCEFDVKRAENLNLKVIVDRFKF
jgi:hypothetical protein